MPRFRHDGLEMWYATPDAPAPEGATLSDPGPQLTIGLRPANPSNSVAVQYRVDGRGAQNLDALLVSNDYQRDTQHFRARFPTFYAGEAVEYLPIATCAGRRVPGPREALMFPSSFKLNPKPPTRPRPEVSKQIEFPARLEHLVYVRASLAPEPEIIGLTPTGFVVNWPPIGGRLEGPAFQATVIPGGEHETTVRVDGVGVLAVRVSVRTDDNALISFRYTGTVEYGENAIARLRAKDFPRTLPVRTEIRMLTADPRYQWLNRLQCIGVGEVLPAIAFYHYDVYAIC
ncbi:MAG: DUF3237 domain-containing protein [Chloroflexi bacterium]|nr:DUF3237 domain-containing protein [Chloroflexota bacterium]